jgi:chemotaxis family two-component system sensor histidine kinase/response regulator PixL
VLNNLVGELVTQDNSHLLHNQQHEETLETLTQWLNRFQGLSQDLQSQINQLTTEAKLVTAEKPDGLEVKDFTNLFSRTKSSPSQIQSTMETVMEELVQIEERVQDLNLLNQKFKQLLKQRQRTLKQVQSNLLQGRMLPVGELLKQFPRMVRDLTTQEHKQVTLQLNGTNTLIDKVILEKLYDPLVHLIRNAFDHGIEPPEVRVHQGKSPQGNITLSTYHRGNQIYIEVQDDGQGINLEKIRNQAVAMNWLLPVEAGTVSKNRLYEYLFASGFSTAEQVSQLSGRGMGLSAVRSQIDALKGIVSIASETGKGTTFTLRLPLTLTIVKLLVFSLNSHLFALPVDTIDSIVVVDEAKLETNQGQQFYQSSAQQIPLYPYALLSSYYYPQIVNASKPLPGQYWQKSGKVTLLLISSGTQVIALKVDQILMEQDLVIKPFNEAIPTPASLCGCTILGDGRLIPVLEGAGLVEKWLQLADSAFNLSIASIPLVFPPVPTILVVDDSLTIRQTLSMTLQKASYRVIQARDGWEALEKLRQEPEIQAVISDIEMPRLNGLEFLSRCRQIMGDELPVIMLTSRGSEKYRLLAKQLGATHYLTKPYLDKELLSILKDCLHSF